MASMDWLSGGPNAEPTGDDQLRQFKYLLGEMQTFAQYSRMGFDNLRSIEGLMGLLRSLRNDLHGLQNLLDESSADETAQGTHCSPQNAKAHYIVTA